MSELEVGLLGAELADLMAAMSVLSDVQEGLLGPGDLADAGFARGMCERVDHAKRHIGKVMVEMCGRRGIAVPNEVLEGLDDG